MAETPLIVTDTDVNDKNLLLRFLRKIADRLLQLGNRLAAVETKPSTVSSDAIRRALEASGSTPLNVNGLLGILAQPQPANVTIYSTAPTGQVLQNLKDGQLLIVPGSPNDSLYYVVGGNPNTLHLLNTTGSVNVADNLFTVYDNVDNTKQFQFQASSISPATTRVYTMPDISSTLAVLDKAQTFTQTQTISSTSDANIQIQTIDTNSTGTGVFATARATADTANLALVAHGTGRTATRCGITLGGWAELLGQAGNGLIIDTLTTAPVVFGNNSIERGRLDTSGFWNWFGGTAANAAKFKFSMYDEEITLSTVGVTTDSSASLLPSNALILGVMGYVTTAITTATSLKTGDPTTNNRFFTTAGMAAGNGFTGLDHWQGSVTTNAAGPVQYGSAKVRLTTDVNPGAGKVRIVVFAIEFTTATS
jgi:hypothetical protein